MKIIIDNEKCLGCGSCTAVAPDVFELNDISKASVIGSKEIKTGNRSTYELPNDISKNTKEDAVMAAESCPAGAIDIDLSETKQ